MALPRIHDHLQSHFHSRPNGKTVPEAIQPFNEKDFNSISVPSRPDIWDNKASREGKIKKLGIEQQYNPDYVVRSTLLIFASLCCHCRNTYCKCFSNDCSRILHWQHELENWFPQTTSIASSTQYRKCEKPEKLSFQTKPGVSFELSLSGNAKFKPKPCVTTTTQKKGLFSEQKQNSYKYRGTVCEAGRESFLSP